MPYHSRSSSIRAMLWHGWFQRVLPRRYNIPYILIPDIVKGSPLKEDRREDRDPAGLQNIAFSNPTETRNEKTEEQEKRWLTRKLGLPS